MKRKIVAILAVALLATGCESMKSFLHMGAKTWLDCHNSERERIYADDDMSADAVQCRELFGEDVD